MDRAHELEDFGPKRLDDAQQNKITEIVNFMTGKASSSFQESKPSSNDFDFEETLTGETKKTASTDDDDFFSDFK